MTPEKRIAAYLEAYRAANGRDIMATFSGGWYRVGEYPSVARWRTRDIEQATAILKYRAEKASGMETREGQDPQGLGAKPDSPSDAQKGAA